MVVTTVVTMAGVAGSVEVATALGRMPALSSPPEGAGEDKAVFATTVRSSAPTKFEVNVVRLDSESGWRQELAVAYLALPRPAGGPGRAGSASLRLRDGAEALGGDSFRLYFGAADATEGTAVASVQLPELSGRR